MKVKYQEPQNPLVPLLLLLQQRGQQLLTPHQEKLLSTSELSVNGFIQYVLFVLTSFVERAFSL
jgi:hypothetical protein